MNTPNASTGFSPFNLKSGFSPRLIPSLLAPAHPEDLPVIGTVTASDPILAPDDPTARAVLEKLELDLLDASDSLLAAKASQSHHANKSRAPDLHFSVGQKVMLATAHRRRDYMRARDGRVAKFMPRFDGPYEVIKAHPDSSLYTLRLPESSKIHPSFHSSQLREFIPNDDSLFPSRTHAKPGPIITEDGSEEYFIDKILDERPRGRGRQYLVRWLGYGPEWDSWVAGQELASTAALDAWQSRSVSPSPPPDLYPVSSGVD